MTELLGPGRPQPNGLRTDVAIARALAVLVVLAIVAALYFAKAIFLPLALAILLTFLLAPAVRLLRNWGMPRVPAVVLVVAFAGAIFLGIGGLVAQQVTQLAQKLPQYQSTIQEKIRSARDAASGGTLDRISAFLRNVNQEIRKKDGADEGAGPPADNAQGPPVPVEIHQPEPAPPQVIQRVLQPLVDPLTTAGLVVIFVIFFLMERQDLRDRFIRLVGSHDLQRTTEALDDGARRLSRYFLAQTSLNVLFGVIVGTGLTFIGVPNPEWGEEVKAVVELQPAHAPADELAGELIAFCRSRLSAFKCPRSVDFVDDLPRQDNGKIYKRVLRERYRSVH